MFYKNLIFLIVGVIVGVRLTDFWEYVKIQNPNGNGNGSTDSSNSLAPIKDCGFQLLSTESNTGELPSLAELLFRETRVLCWIMTTPQNHLKRALHIKRTWGTRCNKLLFMSTEDDRMLETIKLPVQEGRAYLWDKTRAAFRYIYDHHKNDADWFLKADDDTYVIMENLRSFLYQYSADAPVYFGCKFHPFVKQGYMSGGAGYVLSKEALRRFAEYGYNNGTLCSQNNLSEDKEMGLCLQNVGVAAGDARDEAGQERFMPLAPKHLIPIDISKWYAEYLFYKPHDNPSCCSSEAISFHYIKPKEFYILDYILYRLRPFGTMVGSIDALKPKANMTELMKKWRTGLTDNIFKDIRSLN